MFGAFLLIALISGVLANDPDMGRHCTRGDKGVPAGIKFFLDLDRDQAYPFLYLGCGGDNNRYDDYDKVKRPDYYEPSFLCPGYVKGRVSCTQDTYYMFPNSQAKNMCNAGEECRREAFSNEGQCCSLDIIKRFEKTRNPTCGPDEVVQKYPNSNSVFFGRNCTHNFCLPGARCQQGEFDAYCCEKYHFV